MNQLEHNLGRAVIAANGGYFDESIKFFLCINCLCNKICFRISAKLSQLKRFMPSIVQKPHFS